ncbi:MAG: hypothetical protein WA635_03460 [Gallionella sp.]
MTSHKLDNLVKIGQLKAEPGSQSEFDGLLRSQAKYLMGKTFTVAGAYLYTVLRWSPRMNVDLSP